MPGPLAGLSVRRLAVPWYAVARSAALGALVLLLTVGHEGGTPTPGPSTSSVAGPATAATAPAAPESTGWVTARQPVRQRAVHPPTRDRRSRARASVHGTGRLVAVPGRSSVLGSGPLRRYRVQVEEGVATGAYAAQFADLVQRTLGDPRGWGHGGRLSFQRVSSGPVAFTVVLASPRTTDRLCSPLRTGGIFSCYMAGRSVINVMRWTQGASSYRGHLAEYRRYVVNHEVGHALGHDHDRTCRADGLSPVMMQQTKSLYGCRRNAWPYP